MALTIADKLNMILQIKNQLEQVLDSQGVQTDGTFEDVVNKVDEIEAGNSISFTDFIAGNVSEFTSYVTTARAGLSGMKSTRMIFPELVTLSSMKYCSNLDYLYVPKLETVGNGAFEGCTSLGKTSDLEFSSLKTVDKYAFRYCSSLGKKKASFPALETIEEYSFQECTSLTCFEFTNVKTIPAQSFRDCTSLRKVWIPKTCTAIEVWRTSNSVTVMSAPFYGCKKLVVYTDASSALSGWDYAYWNLVDYSSSPTLASVKWGATYQQYLDA